MVEQPTVGDSLVCLAASEEPPSPMMARVTGDDPTKTAPAPRVRSGKSACCRGSLALRWSHGLPIHCAFLVPPWRGGLPAGRGSLFAATAASLAIKLWLPLPQRYS